MSGVFPSVISSTDAIAGRNLTPSRLRHWINLYRDADLIGRSLGAITTPDFSEASIGDGGHSDYYSDSRFWRAVLDIAIARSEPNPGANSPSARRTQEDAGDLADLRMLEYLSPCVALLSIALWIVLLRNYVWVDGAESLLCLWRAAVWMLLAVAAVALPAQVLMSLGLWRQRKRHGVVPLQEYRLWRWPLWYTTLSTAICPLLVLALCLVLA